MTCYLSSLIKAEDPQGYKKMADEGLMVGYPVKINGQSHREDNGVGYHTTVKFFDPKKDHAHSIHQIAQHLPLNPPDAKNTQIEPTTFKDRNGNDVHVLKLKGNSAEKLKEHNSKFSHMGHPTPYVFEPHISVPKAQWDKIKASGAKTAHEAGISFHPAELKRGPKTIKTYHHQPDTTEPRVPDEGDLMSKVPYEPQYKKLAASEKDNLCPMHKAEKLKSLMKPFVSDAQRRWGHTAAGEKALGGKAGVHEWDEATKGKKLPEKVAKTELEKTFEAADPKKPGVSTVGNNVRLLNQLKTPEGKKKAIQAAKEGYSHIDKKPEDLVDFHEKAARENIKDAYKQNQISRLKIPSPNIPDPKSSGNSEKTLAASEKNGTGQPLEKGALKNAGIALGMAGALAGAGHSADAGNRSPASIQHSKHKGLPYNHKKMLNAIAQVESSGGKNVNHTPTSNGDTAYGRYALMPNTIHDTIKGHKDLKAKHGKALALTGQNLHNYMRDNKGLEDTIADRHLSHIEHNFKNDPEKIGFSWNQGITGTKRALHNNQDISGHPYSKKIKEAYSKEK